ncbi:terminase large subunit [uncultured Slackia sp.]|uniref:terminase large subunit n=1 Tax=uncultured Slackia sp. TaxID=665903 RepID=UPI0026DF70E2|nr:terminase TerL endonuclease subunit [uncultured Slackia sp.]
MTIRHDHAAEYCRAVLDGNLSAPFVGIDGKRMAPRYVKLQCAEFLRMWDGEHPLYFVDETKLVKVCRMLRLLKMAKGPNAGKTLYGSLAGFQWLIVTALTCCVHRDDPKKRRYESALLEISRKNGKTLLVAILFLVLFFTEPKFSRFFSVAPDGALAKELKEAIEPLIAVNEEAFDGCFKVTRDYILNKPRSTRYVPLNYSTNRMDGREPNVFIADEIGALPTNYALEAMRSGQLLVKNKLGFAISTKYPTVDNPLEDEVAYAKKVLDGIIEDDALFALLYEPDEPDRWADDAAVLAQGNPLALELEPVWLELLKKREKAIERESLRENFLTKHCNIVYQGAGTESYIPADQVAAAMEQPVDFAGRELYVGVDLAMTNDNCAVAVACEVDGCICADVTAFVPADRVAEKSAFEKLDYIARINAGECVACGDLTVDYSVIEDFVTSIEDKYGGTVVSVGYDRYNALSSAQKWESEGLTTVEVRQHSSVLHPPTKLLAEKAASGKLRLRENKLLEINFANARCTYDTNLNRYVNKKKSNGKVDMVMALIDAVYLLQQDVIFGDDFVCQF